MAPAGSTGGGAMPRSYSEANVRDSTQAFKFQGYRKSYIKLSLFVSGSVLSFGILALLAVYLPRLRMKLIAVKERLERAPIVLATGPDGKSHVCFASDIWLPQRNSAPVRMVPVLNVRHIWDHSRAAFVPLAPLPEGHASQVLSAARHFSQPGNKLRPAWSFDTDGAEQERLRRAMLYGPNEIAVDPPNAARIVGLALIHPLNSIQYIALVIWVLEKYLLYCGVILAVTVMGVALNSYEEYTEKRRIADLARHHGEVLRCSEAGAFESVPSTRLVPGDVIAVRNGELLACDCVLLGGTAVLDESMLTGESEPVPKSPLVAAEGADGEIPRSSRLMGGTRVVLAAGPCHGRVTEALAPSGMAVAIACETGFSTAKGRLVAGILNPTPKLHLDTLRQSLLFIAGMAVIAVGLSVYNIIHLAPLGLTTKDYLFMGFDLITAACPPALPATLAIATAISVRRLAAADIHVTAAPSVALTGLATAIALDKTGTLTTGGIAFRAALPAGRGNAELPTPAELTPEPRKDGDLPRAPPPQGELAMALATCHGLAPMPDGLVGDPLEAELATSTGWALLSAPPPDTGADESEATFTRHGCVLATPPGGGRPAMRLRTIPFDAAAARSGAVVRRSGADGRLVYFVKGAPEAVAGLCDPAALPDGLDKALRTYAAEGSRVIAVAGRELGSGPDVEAAAMRMSPAELEGGARALRFMGLVLLDNPLRPYSAEAVQALVDAGSRVVMITGDHMATALKVARDTGILPAGRRLVLLDADEEPPRLSSPAESTDGAAKPSLSTSSSQTRRLRLRAFLAGEDGASAEGIDRVGALHEVSARHAPIAATGRALEAAEASGDAELLEAILEHGAVFARMRPAQKEAIVTAMQAPTVEVPRKRGKGAEGSDDRTAAGGEHVLFCGDGANDMLALRAALVGVSLCEAEASVAAPMTARNAGVEAVVTVLAEGRAALAGSQALFTYVMSYAFIQTMSMALLGGRGGRYFTDPQFLLADLGFATALGSAMAATKAVARPGRARPPQTLLCAELIAPLLGQFVVHGVFQVASIVLLTSESFYVNMPILGTTIEDRQAPSADGTVLFLVQCAQLCFAALVANTGPSTSFRRTIGSNPWLCGALGAQAAVLGLLLLSPGSAVGQLEGMVVMPGSFRLKLFMLLVLGNWPAAHAVDRTCQVVVVPLIKLWWNNH